jgi:hypothetical protein
VVVPGQTLDLTALLHSISSLAESTKRLQDSQTQHQLQTQEQQRKMQEQLDALTAYIKK